ncbi:hypothetical protein HDU93_003399 [Gonapodya sp. JEL0774]|nr:hypothetical protein HDU93_003399 [Gonapodya sp. JEL0774]
MDDNVLQPMSSSLSGSPALFPSSLNPAPATIVTAYFPLARSKHSHSDYLTWMAPLLAIHAPLVVYTSPSALPAIKSLRDPSLPTEYVILPSPFHLPPIHPHRTAYRLLQPPLDPERRSHSPDLYAIWNAKPFLVAAAINRAALPANVYAWVDVGSFREADTVSNLRVWPDPLRVALAFPDRNASVLFQHIVHHKTPSLLESARSFPTSSTPLLTGDIIAGTTFWGPPRALLAYSSAFYALHDRLLEQGDCFVGKDQTLINSLLASEPSRYRVLRSKDPAQESFQCGDPWFYFQKYFALDSELPPTWSCPRPPIMTFADVLEWDHGASTSTSTEG